MLAFEGPKPSSRDRQGFWAVTQRAAKAACLAFPSLPARGFGHRSHELTCQVKSMRFPQCYWAHNKKAHICKGLVFKKSACTMEQNKQLQAQHVFPCLHTKGGPQNGKEVQNGAIRWSVMVCVPARLRPTSPPTPRDPKPGKGKTNQHALKERHTEKTGSIAPTETSDYHKLRGFPQK